uniref:Uncharacterized protein n=1 Tax=Phaeomonas parva TaxID=124430 RepID=A0A7S1UBN2_9STRA|mmetsp:Transcript_39129/g.122386  ORF Transcript_39129/g.122386 Transcript_39129/m.122386 type:complete len:863 (+) Transcript_39129:57-2645(+)
MSRRLGGDGLTSAKRGCCWHCQTCYYQYNRDHATKCDMCGTRAPKTRRGVRVNGRLCLVSCRSAVGSTGLHRLLITDVTEARPVMHDVPLEKGHEDVEESMTASVQKEFDEAQHLANLNRRVHRDDVVLDTRASSVSSGISSASPTRAGGRFDANGASSPVPSEPEGRNVSLFDQVMRDAQGLVYDAGIGQFVEKETIQKKIALEVEERKRRHRLPTDDMDAKARHRKREQEAVESEPLHGIDSEFEYVRFMQREKGAMTRKIKEAEYKKKQAESVDVDAFGMPSPAHSQQYDTWIGEKIYLPKEHTLYCALCCRIYEEHNLVGVVPFKAVVDWRSERDAPFDESDRRLQLSKIYDNVKLCVFCTQFFDDDFSKYLDYHRNATDIPDPVLELELKPEGEDDEEEAQRFVAAEESKPSAAVSQALSPIAPQSSRHSILTTRSTNFDDTANVPSQAQAPVTLRKKKKKKKKEAFDPAISKRLAALTGPHGAVAARKLLTTSLDDFRPQSALRHKMALESLRTRASQPLSMQQLGSELARVYGNPNKKIANSNNQKKKGGTTRRKAPSSEAPHSALPDVMDPRTRNPSMRNNHGYGGQLDGTEPEGADVSFRVEVDTGIESMKLADNLLGDVDSFIRQRGQDPTDAEDLTSQELEGFFSTIADMETIDMGIAKEGEEPPQVIEDSFGRPVRAKESARRRKKRSKKSKSSQQSLPRKATPLPGFAEVSKPSQVPEMPAIMEGPEAIVEEYEEDFHEEVQDFNGSMGSSKSTPALPQVTMRKKQPPPQTKAAEQRRKRRPGDKTGRAGPGRARPSPGGKKIMSQSARFASEKLPRGRGAQASQGKGARRNWREGRKQRPKQSSSFEA